jgi:hypothetical protein
VRAAGHPTLRDGVCDSLDQNALKSLMWAPSWRPWDESSVRVEGSYDTPPRAGEKFE